MTHIFQLLQTGLWFYMLVAVVSLLICLVPIQGYPAVTVLLSYLFTDSQRVRKLFYLNVTTTIFTNSFTLNWISLLYSKYTMLKADLENALRNNYNWDSHRL